MEIIRKEDVIAFYFRNLTEMLGQKKHSIWYLHYKIKTLKLEEPCGALHGADPEDISGLGALPGY